MRDVFKTCTIMFCIFVSLVVGGGAIAQHTGSVIEGYVFDSETQDVITGANVYLSQTTIGAASDDEGYFRIEKIPPGVYQFVISYIGYETYSNEVQIGESEDYFFERALTPTEVELESVTVTSGPDRQWERNLRRFKKYFIGETENGRKTGIVNPEILNFRTDVSTLHAEAKQELHIVNGSLGYEITVDLTHFEWNYIEDSGGTLYFCRFIEMEPSDENERQRWEQNRQKTYKYSPERFFKTLVEGKYKSQYKTSGGRIDSKTRTQKKEYTLFEESDQIYTFRVLIRHPNHNVTVIIDDLNILGDEETGYIGYNESKEEITEEMFIDPNGNLLNPLDFTLDGVWYGYRLADRLPLNYVPEE